MVKKKLIPKKGTLVNGKKVTEKQRKFFTDMCSMEDGGTILPIADSGIHIKPENKGKFTATKKRTGKSTEELTHSKNPLTRKRAIFAQNAKKWKHEDGGSIAITPLEQYQGLNNSTKDQMIFPMTGKNIFRGLDNGQPVMLQDTTGKQKILTGPQDTAMMKGTVKEKRIKAQQGASVDWNSDWLKSPMAQKMNQGEQDFTTERLQSLKDLSPTNIMPQKQLEAMTGNKSKHLGVYDSNKHTVNINSKIKDPSLFNVVETHEKSHAADKGGKLMSKEDLNMTDSEGRALLNQARYEYQNNGTYDPFTQPFKSEYLKDKNNGIRNLKKKYSDDQITNLMNSVSSIDSKGTPIAKCGKSVKGKMKKAQQGLITQEEKDRRLWGEQNQQVVTNPDAQPLQANPDYNPNQQTQFIDKGIAEPISTSSVKTTFQTNNNKPKTVGKTDKKNDHPSFGVGEALTAGIGMAQMLLGPEGERRRIDNTLAYNPYAYGTGSQALAKKGKSVKPSHQGQGLMTYEGGNAPKVSENIFDGGTHLFTGDSHKDGGIISSFNGTPFEAEGGEPFAKIEGKGVVFGDLVNPVTGRTYKKDAKEIMKKELKISKYLDKGTELVNEKDPTDKFERLAFNSGRVMIEGAATKLKQIADSKAHLAELQEAQLEIEGEEAFAKHGKIIKAQSGVTAPVRPTIEGSKYSLYPNALEGLARKVADEVGLDPNLFHKVVTQESQYNPKAESRPNRRTGENALGLAMLTPKVAKEYGLSKKDLVDDSFEGYSKNLFAGATELKKRIDKYNGDTKLGLLDYNGGEGAVASARRNAKKQGLIKTDSEFTGDIGVTALSNKRKKRGSTNPDLWEVQSVDYVNNIMDADEAAFPQKAANFNKNFYQQPTPDFSLPTPQLQGLTPEEIATMDGKKPNVPNQPATGSAPFEWKKVEPFGIKPTNDKLQLSQIMGETAALFDRPDFVQGQRYNPDLYTPYQVSFQDRINQNSKTFNALQSTMAGNPEALATMAGQQYSANDAVLAEEFRTNQAISNDITNKNVALLNDAKLKNISLIDQQYVRQNQAKSITKQNRTNALNSISSKILQKKASNNLLNTYKNMFPHYDFDGNYQVVKQGPGGEEYVNFPGQVGTNPFATTDNKVQTTYENGVEKSKKVTTEPSYVRDKKYLELQKQLNDLKFNGSIVKKYRGSN